MLWKKTALTVTKHTTVGEKSSSLRIYLWTCERNVKSQCFTEKGSWISTIWKVISWTMTGISYLIPSARAGYSNVKTLPIGKNFSKRLSRSSPRRNHLPRPGRRKLQKVYRNGLIAPLSLLAPCSELSPELPGPVLSWFIGLGYSDGPAPGSWHHPFTLWPSWRRPGGHRGNGDAKLRATISSWNERGGAGFGKRACASAAPSGSGFTSVERNDLVGKVFVFFLFWGCFFSAFEHPGRQIGRQFGESDGVSAKHAWLWATLKENRTKLNKKREMRLTACQIILVNICRF